MGSARRRLAVLAGLLVVALNLLAGLIAPPVRIDARAAVADLAIAETAKALGQSIVICTPSGMITIGPDGKPADAPSGGAHGAGCIFCLPLTAGCLQAPALLVAAFLFEVEEPAEAQPRLSLAISPLPAAGMRPRPRAPPLVLPLSA